MSPSNTPFQNSNEKKIGEEELEAQRGAMGASSETLHDGQQLDPDIDHPRKWSVKKRVIVSIFPLFAPFVATLGTSIYVAAIPEVYQRFDVSMTSAIAPLSLYGFGCGIGALIGTAASEIYGRQIVYVVTLPIFFSFTFVGVNAQNIATLDAGRFVSGLFAGPLITISIGMLNDIWDVVLEKKGTFFALMYGMVLIWATQMGPMVSVDIVRNGGWKWTFWVQAILVGITMIASWVIPETFEPQLVRDRAKRLKLPVIDRGSKTKIFLTAIGRPAHMMLVEPIIFPSAFVISITQAVNFAFYVEYALLFERVYGFSQWEAGMAFSPMLVGSMLALFAMGLSDRLLYQPAREEALRSGATVAPEKRLYPAMAGSIVLPIALFWFAWSGRESVHWIVPVLSGIPFGFAFVLNLFCYPLYINDIYTARYGASCQAVNGFMRLTVAAAFPLFTTQMVDALGFAWATSLFGFVSVAMIPIPWVFFKWGPSLRARSQYLRDTPMAEVK